MRRFLVFAVSFLIPVAVFSQAQLTTKKVKIEDFPEKVTKIVLSGNIFLDGELEQTIKNGWTISPYEFCTLSEFEQLKGKDDYYFLMTVVTRFKHETEPGITILSLLKGGKGADRSLNKMLEVVSIPICSARYPSGREITFLPAIIDIIQEHVYASMARDVNAYGGLANSSESLEGARDMKIIFAENDIAPDVSEDVLDQIAEKGIEVLPDIYADEYMEDAAPNTLVSFTVSPFSPSSGSYCYKMLIDAQTHKLYYYKKHRMNGGSGAGFLAEDLLRISNR